MAAHTGVETDPSLTYTSHVAVRLRNSNNKLVPSGDKLTFNIDNPIFPFNHIVCLAVKVSILRLRGPGFDPGSITKISIQVDTMFDVWRCGVDVGTGDQVSLYTVTGWGRNQYTADTALDVWRCGVDARAG